MENSNNIFSAGGSVVVNECSIIQGAESFDIIPQIDFISIFEDLFSPFMTGFVSMRDTLDLPNMLGRFSNTLLRLNISTPSIQNAQPIKGDFVIYKMSDREMAKDRTQLYRFYFCSIEMYVDSNEHVSKKFSGSGENIIEKIIKKVYLSDKKFNFDPAKNQLTYISNFWTPSKNFAYICDHSLSESTKSLYLFYENRDGFNFKDVSKLFTEKQLTKFTSMNYVNNVTTDGSKEGDVNRIPKFDYESLNALRIDSVFDILRDYNNLAIKTKQYSVDLNSKQIRWSTYNSINHSPVNAHKLYDDEIINSLNPVIINKARGAGVFDNKDISNYKTSQSRISYMRMLTSSKIEIDVFGRTDYTVGRKVLIEIEQIRNIEKNDSDADILDKIYSGYYLITAINHQINREKHLCTIELCKESTLLK
jgi:hypothetical protein